jgi:Predicted type IV restriction endonuclease
MALFETLEAITKNLRGGRYPNEQAVSQGVVLRILHELGWDVYNPDHVWPEYSVAGRRVDFALCFPARKPAVSVEVKQPGRVEGGDQQLFEYAYHHGVPMAILCDGKTWGFYLPAEQGNYDERRVYKLDLLERTTEEAADKLRRYLSFQRTVSSQAIDDARRDYRDRNRRALAQNTISEAWGDLVEGEEPSLIERLATEVETKCGVKPEVDDIVAFLKTLKSATRPVAPPPPATSLSPRTEAPTQHGELRCGFELNGRSFPCRTAKDVVLGILREFTNTDATFPQRCSEHPENQGRVRTYIARRASELYPGRTDLERYSEEFAPGWLVATNISNQVKDKIIKMACEVARITPNVQLRYIL